MTQKEKIKHERVLKLKKIVFWTLNIVSYILAGIFLIVLIISLSTPKKQNVSPRGVNNLYNEQITEVIREDIPNNVLYDDENYQITLSVNELNNYTWNNFNDYAYSKNIVDSEQITDYIEFKYNNITLSFYDGYTSDGVGTENGFYFVQLAIDENDNYIIFNNDDFTDYYNQFKYQSNVNILPLEYNLVLDIDSNYYNSVKTAIELDIASNESSETQTIFESITQVLTNFITTLNSGITSVLNLFWNSTTSQLTLLGNLTTIVIGVAVCFFLFRLVIGLIRLRG